MHVPASSSSYSGGDVVPVVPARPHGGGNGGAAHRGGGGRRGVHPKGGFGGGGGGAGNGALPDSRLLKDLFAKMDEDLSGLVDVGEFYLSLKGTSMEDQALNLFNAIDKDRNGTVTMLELIKHLYPFAGDEDVKDLLNWVKNGDDAVVKNADFWGEGEQDEEIKKMFKSFDKNGDGSLTVKELAQTMCETHALNKKDVEKMFEDLGKTKKDLIAEGEFIGMFKQFIEGDMDIKGHKMGQSYTYEKKGSVVEKGDSPLDNDVSRAFSKVERTRLG